MTESTFDAAARSAAAPRTRRAALLALGAALASGLPGPAAGAGNAGKKGKKRCKRQGAQCVAFLQTRYCAPDMLAAGVGAEGTPAECVESLRPCCALLARCRAGEALSCLLVA